MSSTDSALFDALAANYDVDFSNRAPAQWLRANVYRSVEPLLVPGARVLEIGCGTGVDAVWFAERGCRVLATDVSERMLDTARARAARTPWARRLEFHRIDAALPGLASPPGQARFDLVFANFGVLNCVENLAAFFSFAHSRLEPGGQLVATIMGRFCLWETLYFASRGRIRKAMRRWSGKGRFDSGTSSQTIWFHSRRQALAAARGFEKHMVRGVAPLMPNSEAFALCERFPKTFERLAAIDTPGLIADHYLLALRRL